jgi:ADP-heptose:LPS heptosyltransferase
VKRFAQGIESACQRAIVLAASFRARRRPPGDLTQARRVLFVRHDAIGDMIMTTGVFRRLREVLPHVELDVLAAPANSQVLRGLDFIRAVHIHKRGRYREFPRLRRELHAQQYDAVIDGRAIWPKVGTDTAFSILSSGASRRIGIGGKRNEDVYTDRLYPPAGSHFVECMAAMTEPLGIDPREGDWRPVLHIFADERAEAERQWADVPGSGPKLLVNISAGTYHRQWPVQRFDAALRAVRARHPDLRILVIAPPNEFAGAEAIAAVSKSVAAKPTLRGSFALVQQADVVLTPDTSIAHAASAFVTPTVTMMLAGMEMFIPYRTPGRHVVAPVSLLHELSHEPVVEALECVLGQGRDLEPDCLPWIP